MDEMAHAISLYDDRPFFEVALRYGVQKAIVPRAKIIAIEAEAPKGLVQIADTFGSKYLRPEIDLARKRIVNLASLYLLESSEGDLDIAAKMIRDNTFLSLSRGGSGLLKALFALPEYALLGREQKGHVEEFLEIWSLKEGVEAYRKLLDYRRANAIEIEAGFWFGHRLNLNESELQEEDVEALTVVRTALLKFWMGDADQAIENQIAFASLLENIRKQAKSKTKKSAQLFELANAKARLSQLDLPERFSELSVSVLDDIFTRDIPLILDLKISLDRLVFELKERYYICAHEIEDTSDYDAIVSKEWSKLTRGKTDIDSLLTLFLCVALGATPKTSLPEKTAKTLVKKFRTQGWNVSGVVDFIRRVAPHEKQEGLVQDWQGFVEDAQTYLADDWDSDTAGAMRFLAENCHIKPRNGS